MNLRKYGLRVFLTVLVLSVLVFFALPSLVKSTLVENSLKYCTDP